jgi:hypothetical protein
MTLAQANDLSNDQLLAGLYPAIIEESPVLAYLPWIPVIGTALRYNRELSPATVDFQEVGGTWVEGTGTHEDVTVALKILGGDADVDNFLATSRADTNNLGMIVLEQKVKGFVRKWQDAFVYGDSGADAKEFDGLHVLCAANQRVHAGAGTVPGALSLLELDEMIDLVRPGKPTVLMMTRRTRRYLSQFARDTGESVVRTGLDQFGAWVSSYDGIPIVINDFMTDTEAISGGTYAAKTGGTGSSIFAIRFAEDGVVGLRAGDLPIIEDIGLLETKDATRMRVKAYVATALLSELSLACIDGIDATAVVP